MKDLRDRVAIVTGAASGIGLKLATRFLKEGMDVVIADKVIDDLARAEESLMPLGNVLAVETDVADRVSVQRLADASLERFGAVHLLSNNAGADDCQPAATTILAAWDWTMGVNLLGALNCCSIFLPILARQTEAYIVNTTSMTGWMTWPHIEPYSASKVCVVSLSESLAAEFAMEYPNVGVAVLSAPYTAAEGIDTVDVAQLVIEGMATRKTHIVPDSWSASPAAGKDRGRDGIALPDGHGWPWIRID